MLEMECFPSRRNSQLHYLCVQKNKKKTPLPRAFKTANTVTNRYKPLQILETDFGPPTKSKPELDDLDGAEFTQKYHINQMNAQLLIFHGHRLNVSAAEAGNFGSFGVTSSC